MWKILLGLAVAIAAAAAIYFAGRGDGSRAGAASAEQAHDQATVAQLQAKGDADQAVRVAHADRQAVSAQAVATDFAQWANTSEDANAPLSPDRARRLRDSDVQLCALDPRLTGCPAAP